MKIRILLACGTALATLSCGPIYTFPGGSLSGEIQPPPAEWTALNEQKVVQLEVRPDSPYSVNVWGAGLDSGFYIASGGGGDSVWAAAIVDDPRVRLRIAESVYELRAERVHDDAERSRVLTALESKYDFQPDEEQSSQAWLFRLSAR